MKTNTHGLVMKGLRAAAGETKWLDRQRGIHVQISYDLSDGEVLADYLTQGNFTRYHSHSIIHICNTESPMAMQEIADTIAFTVAFEESKNKYV